MTETDKEFFERIEKLIDMKPNTLLSREGAVHLALKIYLVGYNDGLQDATQKVVNSLNQNFNKERGKN